MNRSEEWTIDRIQELTAEKIKCKPITVAVRLTGPFAEVWKEAKAELGLTPTALLKQCIAARAVVLLTQQGKVSCVADIAGKGKVNMADLSKFTKPRESSEK